MRRWLALIATGLILGALVAAIDRAALWENLKATAPLPFTLAIALFVPQVALMSYRWKMMASHFAPIGWGHAVGMILAGQSMNIVLPSKMGDLTKAYFLKSSGLLDLPRALNLVVFEKMLDLGALCLLALLGVASAWAMGLEAGDAGTFAMVLLLSGAVSLAVVLVVASLYFIPAERLPFYRSLVTVLEARPRLRKLRALVATSHEVIALLQSRRARRGRLALLSIALWVLHLIQIGCFFYSLNAPVPAAALVALMPLAILIGLLPVTLFGLGTRDAAMIFLFAPYHPSARILAVGFYVSLRYFVPALAGLPFLNRYLSLARQSREAESSADTEGGTGAARR